MQKVKSIASVLLAITVFVSTLSFTLEQHFCLGQLVDVALFSDASCGMEDNTSGSCEVSDASHECCDDKRHVIEGQDHETTVNSNDQKVEKVKQSTISAAAIWIKELLFSIAPKQVQSFTHPPNTSLFYSVEHYLALETFLL